MRARHIAEQPRERTSVDTTLEQRHRAVNFTGSSEYSAKCTRLLILNNVIDSQLVAT